MVQKAVGGSSKKVREFMDRLTVSTNVSNYVEIPMIAVMGDTSSGKSSLLSAISMIELPSSSELTTRCPILIHLCRATGQDRGTIGIKWDERTLQESPDSADSFPEINVAEEEWNTLPDRIAEAQQHIITITEKEVARDIVTVKVCGSKYNDLTLVDLPGIVRTAGKHESEDIIADINALIDTYLRNERCVILAVVPANIDFHNSQIMADARKVDPHTTRTIPVITKPDLIDTGSEQSIFDLLLGKKIEFKLGFHMVKGRGQKQLEDKVSIQKALEQEQRYFNNVQPWDEVKDRSQLGTSNLREKLGTLQISLMQKALPAIVYELKSKKRTAKTNLRRMGETRTTLSEKRLYLHQVFGAIKASFEASMSGKIEHMETEFLKDKHDLVSAKLHIKFKAFREKLLKGNLLNLGAARIGKTVIVRDGDRNIEGKIVHRHRSDTGDDEQDYVLVEPESFTKGVNNSVIAGTSVEVSETIRYLDDTNPVIEADGRFYITKGTDVYELKCIPLGAITLRDDHNWMRREIEKKKTSDLECFLNVCVFNNVFAQLVTDDWDVHIYDLIEEISQVLKDTASGFFELREPEAAKNHDNTSHCNGIDRYPKLKYVLKDMILCTIDECVKAAELETKSVLEMEKHPYTQNHYIYDIIQKKKLSALKTQILKLVDMVDAGEGNVSAKHLKPAIGALLERREQRSLEDCNAEDMMIVLEAYTKLSFKRIIDRIPMICWNITRCVTPRLTEKFLSISDASVEELIVDSSEFNRKHERLRAQIKELDSALLILNDLQLKV